ncbi:MAG: hypothetical protein LBS59_00855 [Puniceicoccales bacterium]|nr:hypothetical protein [Puniceicoccales bacterium]
MLSACGERDKSVFEENLEAKKFFPETVLRFLEKKENVVLLNRYNAVVIEIENAANALRVERKREFPTQEEKVRSVAESEKKLAALSFQRAAIVRGIADVYLGKEKPPPRLPDLPWYSPLIPYKNKITCGVLLVLFIVIWLRFRRPKVSVPPPLPTIRIDSVPAPLPSPFASRSAPLASAVEPPFSSPPKSNREMVLAYAYHFQETAKRCSSPKKEVIDNFNREHLRPLNDRKEEVSLELVHAVLRRFISETSADPILPHEWNPSSLEKLKCYDPQSPLFPSAPALGKKKK